VIATLKRFPLPPKEIERAVQHFVGYHRRKNHQISLIALKSVHGVSQKSQPISAWLRASTGEDFALRLDRAVEVSNCAKLIKANVVSTELDQ